MGSIRDTLEEVSEELETGEVTPRSESPAERNDVEVEASSQAQGEERNTQETEPDLPANWDEGARALYAEQPPAVQKWMLERHRAMEGDHTRKTQEVAEQARRWQQYDQILGPHEERLKLLNATKPGIFQTMLNWQDALEANPTAALHALAQTYGLTFSQLAQVEQQAQSGQRIDPALRQLYGEIQQIKGLLGSQQQSAQSYQEQALVRDIELMASEKDATGNPIRPLFNELSGQINHMLGQIMADPASQNLDHRVLVDRAYQAAVAPLKPMIDKQRQAVVQQARRSANAASGITGQSSSSKNGTPISGIRAHLESVAAELGY